MTKKELYDIVYNLTYKTDKYAVGAHLCGNLDVNRQLELFKKYTGDKPAFIDFDMHSLPYKTPSDVAKAAAQLKAFTEEGGFVTLTNHWVVPTVNIKDATCQGANNCRYTLTHEQYREVMTPGTGLYTNFTDELNGTAVFMKKLETLGIPVIYRPLHEGNGAWFWWGVHKDLGVIGKDVADLFRFVHDYYENKCGIHNILWEFNTAMAGTYEEMATWFPGEDYVQIMSTDWYLKEGDYMGYYEKPMALCSKPLPYTIAEFGGDGNYPMGEHPMRESLGYVDAQLEKGGKCAFIGFYFDYPDNIDWTLSPNALTLKDFLEIKKTF